MADDSSSAAVRSRGARARDRVERVSLFVVWFWGVLFTIVGAVLESVVVAPDVGDRISAVDRFLRQFVEAIGFSLLVAGGVVIAAALIIGALRAADDEDD